MGPYHVTEGGVQSLTEPHVTEGGCCCVLVQVHLSVLLPGAKPARSLPPHERPRQSHEEHEFANALGIW